jgi:DNA-binding response OmpR family regulator
MTADTPTQTIILIDDHDDSREVIAAWLQTEGWLVVEFARAEPALAAILRGEGTVVVTDLTLPGMSGVQLAERVREDATFASLPIIALTGREGVAFGPGELFDDLLVKPFDPDELLAAVARLLTTSSRVSRTVPIETELPPTPIPRSSSRG